MGTLNTLVLLTLRLSATLAVDALKGGKQSVPLSTGWLDEMLAVANHD